MVRNTITSDFGNTESGEDSLKSTKTTDEECEFGPHCYICGPSPPGPTMDDFIEVEELDNIPMQDLLKVSLTNNELNELLQQLKVPPKPNVNFTKPLLPQPQQSPQIKRSSSSLAFSSSPTEQKGQGQGQGQRQRQSQGQSPSQYQDQSQGRKSIGKRIFSLYEPPKQVYNNNQNPPQLLSPQATNYEGNPIFSSFDPRMNRKPAIYDQPPTSVWQPPKNQQVVPVQLSFNQYPLPQSFNPNANSAKQNASSYPTQSQCQSGPTASLNQNTGLNRNLFNLNHSEIVSPTKNENYSGKSNTEFSDDYNDVW